MIKNINYQFQKEFLDRYSTIFFKDQLLLKPRGAPLKNSYKKFKSVRIDLIGLSLILL